MKRVVIVGVDAFYNRGVEALCTAIVMQILERFPNVEITILCSEPVFNASRLKNASVNFKWDAYRSFVAKACRKLGILFTPVPHLLSRSFSSTRALIKSADLVISTGGDTFGKDYGGFQNYLTPLTEAARAGVPYVFLGHSIGPFADESLRQLFTEVARNAALITCRETMSLQYVTGTLGISAERVHLVSDVAFLLKPSDRSRAEQILSEHGIQPGEPLIALSISGGISQFSGLDPTQHRKRWAELIRYLELETKSRIVIVPHVWNPSDLPSNNDMVASREVLQLAKDSQAILLGSDYTASEYKAIIGITDFVIAERMHASIAGLSQEIPTVPISYSIKADGIIADLFAALPETDRPVIPISAFMDDSGVNERLLALYRQRQNLKAALQATLPKMHERARMNFELLDQFL